VGTFAVKSHALFTLDVCPARVFISAGIFYGILYHFSEALGSRLGLRAHPCTDRFRGLPDSLHTAALNAAMTAPFHIFSNLL
jgi:hypothetical protein